MGRIGLALAGIGLLLAGAAQAGPITGKAARALLFVSPGAEVEILPQAGLAAADAALLSAVGATQAYYGAIALSPDEDLMVDATVAAANFHDTDSASVAALAQCEAKRLGKTPCVVAALIRPTGWQQRGLQLSADATAGFLADYQGGSGKALASSAATGLWGIATGKAAVKAAIAACAAKAVPPPADCTVVIADGPD